MPCFFAYASALFRSRAATACTITSGCDLAGPISACGLHRRAVSTVHAARSAARPQEPTRCWPRQECQTGARSRSWPAPAGTLSASCGREAILTMPWLSAVVSGCRARAPCSYQVTAPNGRRNRQTLPSSNRGKHGPLYLPVLWLGALYKRPPARPLSPIGLSTPRPDRPISQNRPGRRNPRVGRLGMRLQTPNSGPDGSSALSKERTAPM